MDNIRKKKSFYSGTFKIDPVKIRGGTKIEINCLVIYTVCNLLVLL